MATFYVFGSVVLLVALFFAYGYFHGFGPRIAKPLDSFTGALGLDK